jgi:dihydrodipicolinate synthase/N-acetylneuraminate lyase
MAYTPDNDAFRRQIRTAVDAAGAGRVWAGIGVYRNTYRGTVEKIRVARELGVRGVVLFSYDWAVSEGESDGDRSFLDRVGREMFRRP